MFQPEFKIVIFLNKSVTIYNFADSLSQTGNRLNQLHFDSLLISASHQNLLLGCANMTRTLYLLSRSSGDVLRSGTEASIWHSVGWL